MQKIEIGDTVMFYDTIEKRIKQGQVINIQDSNCEIYVIKEACIYNIQISMVKKI